MMWFKKRGPSNALAAGWVLNARSVLLQKQRQAADWLARRTQYWNRTSWLIALALFCLVFGGCCLLLCIQAFIH